MSASDPAFILASREIIADPYPLYDRLRHEDPVHAVSEGVYFLSRHADCTAALTDARLLNSPAPFALLNRRNAAHFVGADIARHLIAFRDSPEVAPARKALAREFMAFTRTCGPMLTEVSREHQAVLSPGARIDFVTEVAMPCALRGMCRVLGFPETDADRLKAWSADFFHLFHAIPDRATLLRLNTRLAEFRDYTRGHLEARRAAPRNDLLSQLAGIDPAILDDTALIDNVMLLAADGVENVWAGMANALLTVLTHPAETARHLAQGGTWPAVIAECLRLESPGQYQGRIVSVPLEIGGTTLRKYSVVLVGLAAANRDPAAFEAPDRFRPGRQGTRDLAFGLGPHACLGKTLVMAQMTALFECLAPHLPDLRLDASGIVWDGRAGHRWLKSLPVDVKATARDEHHQSESCGA